ncbi:FKBP-type peptidyl-prolyl cis-trans isomerase [Bombella sp. ESL0378]|nr:MULTISPECIES: FKBP-type peptidyl-prolyl cis-trans isomerase [Bombella]MCX5615148.1 FKBP-type peptidyl-prolyl cis-trans isomerase [Bombella saccharophila]MUG04960.1 FKBP-type peptidyl-prolyl cis-trans isomerase [Bombella sp. ESL0378]MUG90509.1 FKBP-type peptidyl-prolyl cis-trans isomerase [Bombella sp. ESL0385]
MSHSLRSFFRYLPICILAGLIGLAGCAGKPKQELSPQQFMDQVYKQPGVHKQPDGLAYKILKSGPKDSPHPQKGGTMMIIYEGRLPDGGIFDSSEMHTGAAYMEMPLDGVIEGWMEGLPLMRVGDVWELYVPPKLGYGKRSMGVIPPNSPLIFKIQLLGVEDDAGLQ